MVRLKSLLSRLTRPLKAIEYVLPLTLLALAAISIVETLTVNHLGKAYLAQLLDQYEVISIALGLLGAFAIMHLAALFAPVTDRTIRARQIALFSYAVGLFFISMITVAAFGALSFVWLNELSFSVISAILYLNLRLILNEYQR